MLETVGRLKAAMGIPDGDASQDARLAAYILAAGEMIEAYCCRQLERKERLLELPEFDGRRALLKAYPVACVAAVELDGAAVGGWRLDKSAGILALPRRCSGALAVTYTGGYVLPCKSGAPKLPETLRLACGLLAQALACLEDNGGQGATQERIGDYSITYGRNVVGSGAGAGSEGGLLVCAPAVAARVRPVVARGAGRTHIRA
jgi:hypothetical protein